MTWEKMASILAEAIRVEHQAGGELVRVRWPEPSSVSDALDRYVRCWLSQAPLSAFPVLSPEGHSWLLTRLSCALDAARTAATAGEPFLGDSATALEQLLIVRWHSEFARHWAS